MNFGFEDVEETFSADLLSGLWALENGPSVVAESARFWRHLHQPACVCFFLKDDFKSLLDVTDRD